MNPTLPTAGDHPDATVLVPSLWEVVRISDAIGGEVLLRLLEHGVPLGPIWHSRKRGTIEVVVPPGTASQWPFGHHSVWVTCARDRRANSLPSQRRWITRPSDHRRPPATEPVALVEAITGAIARARLDNSRASAVSYGSLRPGLPPPRRPGTVMHRYSPLDLPAELRSLSEARRHVRTTLAHWYVPSHVADAVRQVAHELAANAVVHGAGDGGVSVSLFLDSRALTVIVGNDGRLDEPLHARQASDDDGEHGRGLAIVDEYADDWGHYATHTRVVVWANFTLHFKEMPR